MKTNLRIASVVSDKNEDRTNTVARVHIFLRRVAFERILGAERPSPSSVEKVKGGGRSISVR